jgi:hypothetical protein
MIIYENHLYFNREAFYTASLIVNFLKLSRPRKECFFYEKNHPGNIAARVMPGKCKTFLSHLFPSFTGYIFPPEKFYKKRKV